MHKIAILNRTNAAILGNVLATLTRSRITSAIYCEMEMSDLVTNRLGNYIELAVRIACDRFSDGQILLSY
jgi:hypothetical protein